VRIKALLILTLISAIFVSSTVGTLSGYTAETSFGVEIVTEPQKAESQEKMLQEDKREDADGQSTAEAETGYRPEEEYNGEQLY